MVSLEEPLRDVVGGKAATRAEKAFGLRTTGDLLRHYPRRYVRRGDLTDLASLRDGEDVTVFAQVAKLTTRRMRSRRGRLLEVTVTDGRARLALTFFNKVEFWERQLSPVYPATRDFSSWDIEKCVRVVLDVLGEVDDPLPGALRQQHQLDGLAAALRGI